MASGFLELIPLLGHFIAISEVEKQHRHHGEMKQMFY